MFDGRLHFSKPTLSNCHIWQPIQHYWFCISIGGHSLKVCCCCNVSLRSSPVKSHFEFYFNGCNLKGVSLYSCCFISLLRPNTAIINSLCQFMVTLSTGDLLFIQLDISLTLNYSFWIQLVFVCGGVATHCICWFVYQHITSSEGLAL